MNKLTYFIFTYCVYLLCSSANAGTCETNTQPEIQNKSPSLTTIAGETYSHDFYAIDPDGDPIYYNFYAWPDQDNMSITNSGFFEWTVPRKASYAITIYASDNICGEDRFDFVVDITDPNNTAPILQNKTPPDTAYVGLPYSYDLSPYDFDGDTVEYIFYKPTVGEGFGVDSSGTIQWTPAESEIGEHEIFIMVRDTFGGTDSFTYHVNVLAPQLPPDPAEIAPSLSKEEVTNLKDATAFIYSGENPIQEGVNPGTIKALSASVIRGSVSERNNSPLSGVTISIKDRPEFGTTLSREDGKFDMAVNGGKPLTILYQKEGYLPVQRKIDPQWRQFNNAEEVVLIPLDTQASTINFDIPSAQVARGSVQNDLDGNRQATIIIPQGTGATLHLPDGSTQTLSTGTLRATEYTVGSNGALAMPGELPPTTAYTYAVELSLDEAISINAQSVEFNQTLPFYVENFLNLPVGEIVPSGYYDRQSEKWIPSDNGKIIQVLSIESGLAVIDIIGNGSPSTAEQLAELGINDEELTQLASLYTAGSTLWRVPINHFTPFDLNFPFGLPDTAEPPPLDPEVENEDEPAQEDNNECEGCIIEPQSQTLGESIPVVGTNQSLHYHSSRVPGYKVGRTISIPISSATPPEGLRDIELIVEIAGQSFRQTFSPEANQNYTFEWNGQDAYGRDIPNAIAKITINYRYHWVIYSSREDIGRSFGRITDQLSAIGNGRISATRGGGSNLGVVSRTWTKQLSHYVSNSDALGGWTLSNHHSYDPKTKTLYKGDGTSRTIDSLPLIATTVAGNGTFGFSGDEGEAIEASLGSIADIEFGADGSIYLADATNRRIRKIDPEGTITTIAGNGTDTNSGDGGEAINAGLATPQGIALAPNGDLYISTFFGNTIRKVDTNGIITTVAGSGNSGFAGDDIPATEASFNQLVDVDVDPEGHLIILDASNPRIHKVDGNDIIFTYAGTGYFNYSGDGGLATSASFRTPRSIAFDPDGNLWIADMLSDRLRKITSDGVISSPQISGSSGFVGDGGLLENARFNEPRHLAFAPDGSLYIADRRNKRIRKVDPEGIINTVVGTGNDYNASVDIIRDGAIALKENISEPNAIAVSPEGELYYFHPSARVRKLSAPLPGFSTDDVFVASESGNVVYIFNSEGRHLETRDTITNVTLLSFSYTPEGQLSTINDVDNNTIIIERNTSNVATAIVAEFEQRTNLLYDENDFLNQVINPANESYRMHYTNDGLMDVFTDRKEYSNLFTYLPSGRLIEDTDPAGGGWVITTENTTDSKSVTMTSREGRAREFTVETLANGTRRHINTKPDGTETSILFNIDGSQLLSTADGTQVYKQEAPDERFGMHAPLVEAMSITTPSGLTSTATTTRTVELADPNEKLSVTRLTSELILNDQTFTSIFEATTNTWTNTTPEGRFSESVIDNQGRVILERVPGLADIHYSYDSHGRIDSVIEGSGEEARTYSFTYGTDGLLESILDPLNQSIEMTRDNVGRVLTHILEDDREISFTYDANGNTTGITPPGRPTHEYDYSEVDLTTEYSAPDIGSGVITTNYSHNLDKQITELNYPAGQNIDLHYDSAGRISEVIDPEGSVNYSYHPDTGKLIGITSLGINLQYTYDGMLQTSESWSGELTGSLNKTYNNELRQEQDNINGTHSVTYDYDNDGLIIQSGAVNIIRDVQNGSLSSTNTDTLTTTYSYNIFGELSHQNLSVDENTIYDVNYSYDKLGRITQKIESIGGSTNTFDYVYDLTGRLTQVSTNGLVTGSYVYDANDNRTSAVVNSVGYTASVDHHDKLNQYSSTNYFYDLNGTLHSKTNSSGTTSYHYDAIGNLREVTLPDTRVITYIIDGNDRRVAKQINGNTVQNILYDGQYTPIAELDNEGNVINRYIYGLWDHVPIAILREGKTYRIISDSVGSVRLVVDSTNGNIAQRIDYDEWGNIISDSNPGFQLFGFAGGIYDQDTGLVRFGARDYDPEIGRWTATDPIGHAGQDTNLYAYAYNDPINNADPSGQFLNVLVGCAIGAGSELAWQYIVEEKSTDCIDWVEVAKSTAGGCAGAGALNKLGKLGKAANCVLNSFSGETPVHTETGLKPIEDIIEGEKVLTFNQSTQELSYEIVTDVLKSSSPKTLFNIQLETGKEIEATADHPFYVQGKSWIPAKNLKPGDLLQTHDSETVKVLSLVRTDKQAIVYNLSVANTNTYFAGSDGVLVHNAKSCGSAKKVRNPYGSKGKPDHQRKVDELADRARSEAGPDETVLTERGVRGHMSRRRPDVQIVDSNGRTRKIFEAERRPTSRRNRNREDEYNHLGIENETHGLD